MMFGVHSYCRRLRHCWSEVSSEQSFRQHIFTSAKLKQCVKQGAGGSEVRPPQPLSTMMSLIRMVTV